MTGIPVAPGELVDTGYLNEVARARWRSPFGVVVINTVTETDLLGGLVTIGAGAMSTNRMLRMTMVGYCQNNSGASVGPPRFKLKLGATTLFDTGTPGAMWASSANFGSFRAVAEIGNTGAANSQRADLTLELANSFVNNQIALPATGVGIYSTDASNFLRGLLHTNAAVDTTVAQALQLTVTLPSANANLQVASGYAIVEIV